MRSSYGAFGVRQCRFIARWSKRIDISEAWTGDLLRSHRHPPQLSPRARSDIPHRSASDAACARAGVDPTSHTVRYSPHMPVERLSLRVLAGLAVLASAVPAAIAAAGDASTFTIDQTAVHASWKEGWLRPGAAVRFAGTLGAPATLHVVLRPVARPNIVTVQETLDVAQAGAYSEVVKLPPRPLPGAYTLTVRPSTATGDLAPVTVRVSVPTPPEGVLDRALVSTTKSGPWQRFDTSAPVVHGEHRQLWARFAFLAPPTGKNISIVWRLNWHRLIGVIDHRYKASLDTFVRSGTALPSGAWTITLSVDGRVAKRAEIRIA
jgi:hypothetical protein